MDSRAQHFVVCWFSTILFVSYYFLEFNEFIFSFQDAYNSWLKVRYMDTWMILRSIKILIWICGWMQNRPVDPIEIGCTYSLTLQSRTCGRPIVTVGYLQSILSTQTPEFMAMLYQRVQARTIHLNEKYKRLTADYEELCRLIMEMRSRMGGTCAPLNWPHGRSDDQPPPPSTPPLF